MVVKGLGLLLTIMLLLANLGMLPTPDAASNVGQEQTQVETFAPDGDNGVILDDGAPFEH